MMVKTFKNVSFNLHHFPLTKEELHNTKCYKQKLHVKQDSSLHVMIACRNILSSTFFSNYPFIPLSLNGIFFF